MLTTEEKAPAQTDGRIEAQDERIMRNRTVTTILPVLEEWNQRGHGTLTFHITQVLTGHGCHGQYLHRIARESTSRCHHCDARLNSLEHTVQKCPTWREQRTALRTIMGEENRSLKTIVRGIVSSREK